MLPDQYRLRKSQDFETVREKGRVFQSESFALAAAKREDREPPRFGFVVSTKISKKATLRNRVKRALREAVRHLLVYLPRGQDFVFLAKSVSVNKTTDEIMREVKIIFQENEFLK